MTTRKKPDADLLVLKRELFALILFYEERGSDWRFPAEFTLFKANGGNFRDLYRAPWQRRKQ